MNKARNARGVCGSRRISPSSAKMTESRNPDDAGDTGEASYRVNVGDVTKAG